MDRSGRSSVSRYCICCRTWCSCKDSVHCKHDAHTDVLSNLPGQARCHMPFRCPKTVSVENKLSIMRKFLANLSRRRRIPLTRSRTSRSKPRASLWHLKQCTIDRINAWEVVIVHLPRDWAFFAEHGNHRCPTSSDHQMEKPRQVALTVSNGLRLEALDSANLENVAASTMGLGLGISFDPTATSTSTSTTTGSSTISSTAFEPSTQSSSCTSSVVYSSHSLEYEQRSKESSIPWSDGCWPMGKSEAESEPAVSSSNASDSEPAVLIQAKVRNFLRNVSRVHASSTAFRVQWHKNLEGGVSCVCAHTWDVIEALVYCHHHDGSSAASKPKKVCQRDWFKALISLRTSLI